MDNVAFCPVCGYVSVQLISGGFQCLRCYQINNQEVDK